MIIQYCYKYNVDCKYSLKRDKYFLVKNFVNVYIIFTLIFQPFSINILIFSLRNRKREIRKKKKMD